MNIKGRIKTLTPLIKEKQLNAFNKAIENYKDNNKINSLRIKKLKDEFELLTTLIKEHSIIVAELKVASEALTELNAKKESLKFEMAQGVNPWTLIKEPSFKATRIYPSYSKELSIFALLGIFSGFVLVCIRDKFDDVYHSPKEIETEIKAPILGNIPFVEYFSDVREKKKSILEVF